ncbi:heavy-metal-associated domain-containing protein [Serratia rhizosphaerae]|uniref:Heavy-metal-associated domain-containing protein n=1 Tax=Serratia rhizosphaerae TaxID=2597702 RepID=A0ABX6GNM7_9GAMM|nr:heavy-metal-associated domain-containing protein [Serratia rhizosphaerae]MEB6334368.1 heavy-metal-associated domain-containing protein [Serratia rhizosphaerae]QHA87853.1 heavy-metal-associated domain-containing protein [Serratia rhizosphaerae]
MNHLQLHIPTMKCGGCAASIAKMVKARDPLAQIDADPATKRVIITSRVDGAELMAELAAAGFHASVESD